MSSINLLPKNVNLKKEAPRSESNFVLFVSFLMVFVSLAIPIGLVFNNQILAKRVQTLDQELTEKDNILQEEFENNEILNLEKKIDDANTLLSSHKYYSKILQILQDDLIENVFLEKFTIKKERKQIVLNFTGIAKTNLDIARQVSLFKKKEYAADIFINDISVDKNDRVEFSGTLYIDEDKINY